MGLSNLYGARVLRRRLLRAHEPAGRRGRQGPRTRARSRGQGREARVQEYSEIEALKALMLGVRRVTFVWKEAGKVG